jgi:hypothetical protein
MLVRMHVSAWNRKEATHMKSLAERPPMSSIRVSLAASLALISFASTANAAEEVQIEGQYLQNRHCKGDRTDPAGMKVTIAPREITYSGGVCSIDSRRDEERKVTLTVTCKFRSGAVSGADIAFEPREGGSLHMTQQDGTFEADLYKCPK